MLIINSILALAVTTAVTGFIVPKDLPAGRYTVEAGSDTPVLVDLDLGLEGIEKRVAHPHGAPNLLKRLDNPRTSCDGYTINGGEYQVAYDRVNNWCNAGNTLQGNSMFFQTNGAAVAYVCNYTPSINTCILEFRDADAEVNTICGSNRAGSVYIARYAKAFGRAKTGVAICFAN